MVQWRGWWEELLTGTETGRTQLHHTAVGAGPVAGREGCGV